MTPQTLKIIIDECAECDSRGMAEHIYDELQAQDSIRRDLVCYHNRVKEAQEKYHEAKNKLESLIEQLYNRCKYHEFVQRAGGGYGDGYQECEICGFRK